MYDFYVCGQTMSGEGMSVCFSNSSQEAEIWEKIKHLKIIEFMQITKTSTQSILESSVHKLQITESKSIKIHQIIKMLENSKDSILKIPALRLRGFFILRRKIHLMLDLHVNSVLR